VLDTPTTHCIPADHTPPHSTNFFAATTAPLQETDPHRIAQRLKQIKLGKNTLGYQTYLDTVPKDKREKKNPRHPNTPNVHRVCSKRQFDGLLKSWRRALHTWDPRTVEQRRADTSVTFMDGNKRKKREGEKEGGISMDWTLTREGGDVGVKGASKKSRTGETPQGKGGKEQQYQEVDYEDDDLDNIGL
jgi:hypothetical protein